VDEKGFREFIEKGIGVPKGLSERTIRSHIRIVKEFEGFLGKSGRKRQFTGAKERDIKAFTGHLEKEDRLRLDSLMGLLRYARFSGNDDVNLALVVMLRSDLLPTMCMSFKKEYGKSMHDRVLDGFEPPAIGTSAKQMPKATSEFLRRLESGIGEDATRKFLENNCPDAGPLEYYSHERELFLSSKDIDDYLLKRRREFIGELEGHMRNGTLFYEQKIDHDVIEFVRNNPEVDVGARRGNTIYHTKIPYMTIDYLRERDSKMRRYYYCHCPLARESILSGKTMSHSLCYCSAGYCKRPFEAAFAKPLKAEVMKSVLWGDSICQFAIHIPRELMPNES